MSELPVTIYSPASPLREPGRMMRAMGHDVMASRELAWRLFVRDISAQYRQTYFGYIWAFIPPLVGAMTFIYLNAQGIVRIEGTGVPYAAFAMVGTLLWQTFVDALQAPSLSLTQAKPMLAKINFPREAIFMSGFYVVLFNLLIRLVLVAGVLAWWKLAPDVGLLLFPMAMAGLIICGFAIGLAIAPLGMLYGDVGKSLPVIAQFLMLLTPVVYPAKTTGLGGMLTALNPVSPLIVTARESLVGASFTALPAALAVSGAFCILLLLGWIGFRIAIPHLVARMGG